MKTILGAMLGAGLLASPAFAQSSSGAWNGLSDRFQIDTGYFRITADTVLRYNGPQGSGDVSLEDDLGVGQNANTFWVDATWRVGRRHQLKLAYTRFTRDRADYTLQRDLTWGGEIYNAGLSATTTSGSDILGGYYRFAAYRNDRFEIGPTIGLGYLWISAGIRATGTVGDASRALDQSASTGSITGAVGGYANGWLTKRLVARADYLYIKVKPGDSEASVTDWRLGADYYFFRNAGLGVQYKYNKYSYDHGILVSKLGGQVTLQGGQIFLTFLF
jgi:predicted porin